MPQVTDGGMYLPKVSVAGSAGSIICILDPMNPEMDVGRSSYGYLAVKQAFQKGYRDLMDLIKYSGVHPLRPQLGKRYALSLVMSVRGDIATLRKRLKF